MISLRIKRCSLLLLDEEEIGVYVRTHYAAHEVINILVNELPEQNSELSIRLKEQGRKMSISQPLMGTWITFTLAQEI